LELRTGNPQQLASAVLAGELDAALVTEPVPDEPFEKKAAFREELVIVAPADHPPIGRTADVPGTMIAVESGVHHRQRLEAWYAKRGEMPKRTIELASYHAMLGCVAAGMGIALVPKSVLSAFPARRRLSIHRLPSDEKWAETVLIWRRKAGS